MNLHQIIRRARLDVDAIRADGTTSALWSTEETKANANSSMDRAGRILRLAGSNLLTKTMKSTDSTADLITEQYAPSSLAIVADTSAYSLPPDYVAMVNIIPLTTNYEAVRFRPADAVHKWYTDQRTIPSDSLVTVTGDEYTYLYTILGARTLRLVPIPQDSFDIEIEYRYRPPRLLTYSTGSITVTNGSTAVHGTGTLWLTDGIRTPAELLTVADASVVLDKQYPRVLSIEADNELTLARAWGGPTATTSTYSLSMVPLLPDEHHEWLARMTGAIMLNKINLELANTKQTALEMELMNEVRPEITSRQVQESLATEPFEV